MQNKLIFSVLVLCLFSICLTPLMGQGATMGSPVVRIVENDVRISVRLENFNAEDSYRIGVGVAGETAPSADMTLTVGANTVGEVTEFIQGFTAHWWDVEQIAAKGLVLSGENLPASGEEGSLQITIPRDSLENTEKLYIFISKDYGSETWYLEDGSELDQSFW